MRQALGREVKGFMGFVTNIQCVSRTGQFCTRHRVDISWPRRWVRQQGGSWVFSGLWHVRARGSLGAEKETRVPPALPRRASEKRWRDHRLCEHFPEEERGSGVPGRSWRLMWKQGTWNSPWRITWKSGNASILLGLPRGASSKEPACHAGDVRDAGSIPGSGRSLGGRPGNALQSSCLENPMDRGAGRPLSIALQGAGRGWSDLAHTHPFGSGWSSTTTCRHPGVSWH